MEIFASPSQHIDIEPFYALIVAGGRGARLGGDVPKQYQLIGEKTVLRHTVERFLGIGALAALQVVIHPDHRDLYNKSIDGLNDPRLRPPAKAGAERQDSVYNGLCALQDMPADGVIVVHDAARPFVTPYLIENLVRQAAASHAATLALSIADTLHTNDGGAIDRDMIRAIQTPQAFHFGLLRTAHEDARATAKIYTDDAGLVAATGVRPILVDGTRENFKITTSDDLALARLLYAGWNRMETRIGTGFDVHAFTDADGTGPVRLCGLDIPHTRGLAGHSDADVGLHTLTDAIFGALADGDIGQHFPPSDPQWKGKDSAFFLQYAVERVKARGGRILHLDLTLICEAPKIGPHRDKMRARVAEICDLPLHRVSVKATTTERLGFTGRQEGIAAQAAATLQLPVQED